MAACSYICQVKRWSEFLQESKPAAAKKGCANEHVCAATARLFAARHLTDANRQRNSCGSPRVARSHASPR